MWVKKVLKRCVSSLAIATLLLGSIPVDAADAADTTVNEPEAVVEDAGEIVSEEVVEITVPEVEEETETEGAPVDQVEMKTRASDISLRDEIDWSDYAPDTPTWLQIKSKSYNSVYLKWNALLYSDSTGDYYAADAYIIYRSSDDKKTYEPVGEVSCTKIKGEYDSNNKAVYYYDYTDKKLTTGKKYYYKIVAYYEYSYDGDLVKAESKDSAVKGVTPVPSKPALKVANVNETKLKLTWGEISGASGYVIQRSTKKTSGFKTVKTITKGVTVSYTDTKLTLGKTYYYRIRAYRTVSGKRVYSSYSSTKSLQVKLKKPTLNQPKLVSSNSNKVKMSWSKVNKAQGYIIYRATSQNGKYSKYKTVKGGSKTSTTFNQTVGPSYYYKIRAYRKVGSKNVYSPYSVIKGLQLYYW